MTLHIPGTTGERSLDPAVDLLQESVAAAQQRYGDDPAKASMLVQLAFGLLYYVKQEVISLESLAQAYGELRAASAQDISSLQAKLARLGA